MKIVRLKNKTILLIGFCLGLFLVSLLGFPEKASACSVVPTGGTYSLVADYPGELCGLGYTPNVSSGGYQICTIAGCTNHPAPQQPAQPDAIQAEAVARCINYQPTNIVSWNVSNNRGYQVVQKRVSTNQTWTFGVPGSTYTYPVTDVIPGEMYEYYVQGDLFFNTSTNRYDYRKSNVVTVTTVSSQDCTDPNVIDPGTGGGGGGGVDASFPSFEVSSACVNGNNRISLDWTFSYNGPNSYLNKFNIYRYDFSSGNTTQVVTGLGGSYRHRDYDVPASLNGQRVGFALAAFNGNQWLVDSSWRYLWLSDCTLPGNFNVNGLIECRAGLPTVDLSWTSSSLATNYVVKMANLADNQPYDLANIDASQERRFVFDTFPPGGGQFNFVVIAYRNLQARSGSRNYSLPFTVPDCSTTPSPTPTPTVTPTPVLSPTPTSTPTSTTVAVTGTSACRSLFYDGLHNIIAWNDAGGSYDVYRDGQRVGSTERQVGQTNFYIDENVQAGQSYQYEVRTANGQGALTVTTTSCGGRAPTGGSGGSSCSGSVPNNTPSLPRNQISWDNVGAGTYLIYRDGDFLTSAGNTSYQDENVTTNETYSYSILANFSESYISGYTSTTPPRPIITTQNVTRTIATIVVTTTNCFDFSVRIDSIPAGNYSLERGEERQFQVFCTDNLGEEICSP